MKKYIIRDSKGQKTITYAKNIVDAVKKSEWKRDENSGLDYKFEQGYWYIRLLYNANRLTDDEVYTLAKKLNVTVEPYNKASWNRLNKGIVHRNYTVKGKDKNNVAKFCDRLDDTTWLLKLDSKDSLREQLSLGDSKIVDAVSYIKDREPVQSSVSRHERVDMNYIKKKMWQIYNITWFSIDKLKVSFKNKTKKELTLYVTAKKHTGYQFVEDFYFVLYLKDHKSEDDLIKHAEELEKDLSRLVGKSYKEPLKTSNTITKTIKQEVFVHPDDDVFYFDWIVQLASSANIPNFITKKSKVEVFNKDKITVSLPVVGKQTELILLFTLLSKECKTKEEFKEKAEKLKDRLKRFSNIPSREWTPMY